MSEIVGPSIFGYFSRPEQVAPVYDPGMDVPCPFCLVTLTKPVRTTSLMVPGDDRSFFYRAHRHCALTATEKQIAEIEGSLVDTRVALRGAP